MCGAVAAPTKIHGAIVKILSDLKLARFQTPSSLPLATLPSMSLIPSAPFCRLHFAQPAFAKATASQGAIEWRLTRFRKFPVLSNN